MLSKQKLKERLSLKLLIASHNEGKVNEFKSLFQDYDFEIESLLDYPEMEEIEETGKTFEENARLKAETIAQEMGVLVLADDSGLVVPILNGEPGIYSARYAGEPTDSEKNMDKLLANLKDVEDDDRVAYFVSCIVLAHPVHESLVVEGRCYGKIVRERQGEGGFGYDPIFYYSQEGKTFGELSAQRKNEVSHRAIATTKLMKALPAWLDEVK